MVATAASHADFANGVNGDYLGNSWTYFDKYEAVIMKLEYDYDGTESA
jgi:hypothetical protein